MSYLTDLVFAIVGLLTIAVYEWLVLVGSLAEIALLVASSGGLLLGVLASAALRIVVTSAGPPGETGETGPGGSSSTAEAIATSTTTNTPPRSRSSPRDASPTTPGLETT